MLLDNFFQSSWLPLLKAKEEEEDEDKHPDEDVKKLQEAMLLLMMFLFTQPVMLFLPMKLLVMMHLLL